MNRICRQLVLAVLLAGQAESAEPIGLRFTGQLFQGATVFGTEIAVSDPVTGYIIYDPAASLTHQLGNCQDCSGYQQDRVGGFVLEVGPLTIWANSYLANVLNDQIGLFPGSFEDVLGFENRSGLSPQLASSLLVNGTPQPTGALNLALTANDTLFSNDQLPQDPVPSSFPVSNILIQDASVLLPAVVTSLQRFSVIRGDLNFDEVVSYDDYDVWRSAFGSIATPLGDANGDGGIDAADYTVWRDALDPSGTAVPEPSCVMLLLLAWMTRLALSRQRPSHVPVHLEPT